MYFDMLLAVLALFAFAFPALASPLVASDTSGHNYCAPFNPRAPRQPVALATDPSGEFSWRLELDGQNRSIGIGVAEKTDQNITNVFSIDAGVGAAPQEYRFRSTLVNGVQHCISAVSASDIRDAPCESPLAFWTIACQSCGEDGSAAECLIENTAFGTCATIQTSLGSFRGGAIKLAHCGALGTGNGTTHAGNQIWFIVPTV